LELKLITQLLSLMLLDLIVIQETLLNKAIRCELLEIFLIYLSIELNGQEVSLIKYFWKQISN